jgi:hypothetical protein
LVLSIFIDLDLNKNKKLIEIRYKYKEKLIKIKYKNLGILLLLLLLVYFMNIQNAIISSEKGILFSIKLAIYNVNNLYLFQLTE